MVIAIFGESCTGKSTLADLLAKRLNARVYSGKDYLRFAKNEADAKKSFCQTLGNTRDVIVYVVTENDQLSLLPANCLRVLATADIETIKSRLAKRMGGVLPAPVGAMLERKHGMFDREPRDLTFNSSEQSAEIIVDKILNH